MSPKISYWLVTGLFGLLMATSAIGYLTGAPQMVQAFHHLGYPDYFRTLLGVAKVLGILALLVPVVPRTLREWAYAGFTINLISAAVSHLATGDGIGQAALPIGILALLLASYTLWHKLDKGVPAQVAPASSLAA